MNRTTIFSAVLIAAAMAVPTGLAGWGSIGGAEPDSAYDTKSFMFHDAPTGTSQVYFNAYISEGFAVHVPVNQPELGSREQAVGSGAWRALLGVWADCNHDGYIGMADGALTEYRVEEATALGQHIDTSICPVTPETGASNSSVPAATHNDGNWITELIPLARVKTSDEYNATNYRVINDPQVKVWGDLHSRPVTPDAPVVPSDRCAHAGLNPPFSTGETSHTGGILFHVQCIESTRGPTPDTVWLSAASQDPTGTLAHTTQNLPLGLGFGKPSDLWASGHPGDVQTFGSDNSHNSYVSGESDCSKSAQSVSQTVAGRTVKVTYFPPGTPHVNPNGDVAGTVNETHEETPNATVDSGQGPSSLAGDNCNTGDDYGHDFYGNGVTESGTPSDTYATAKSTPDMSFFYEYDTRSVCDAQTVWQFAVDHTGSGDPVPNDPAVVPPALCGTPSDYGLPARDAAGSPDEWFGETNWAGLQPATGVVDANRATYSTSDTFRADYYTFYAHVSNADLQTPGGVGSYGAEFCPTMGTNAPSLYGWNCDPAAWNLDAKTGQKSLTVDQTGTIGDAYELRDTDCYDTTLVGASDSPTGHDIGGRTLPLVNDPNHGCQ